MKYKNSLLFGFLLFFAIGAHAQRSGGPVNYNPKIQFRIDPSDFADEETGELPWPAPVPLHGEAQYGCFIYAAESCSVKLFIDASKSIEKKKIFGYAALKNRSADLWLDQAETQPWKVTAAQEATCEGKRNRVVFEFKRDPFQSQDPTYEPQTYKLVLHYHHCVYEKDSAKTRFIESAYEFSFGEIGPKDDANAILTNQWVVTGKE